MRQHTIACLLSVALGLVTAGCAATPPPTPTAAAVAPPTAVEAVSPLSGPESPMAAPAQDVTGSGITGEAPQSILDAVVQDAASRTGVPAGELIVVQDQAVEWPDGSLGCPEPGMMYTQALVNGYHVLIQAGGELLDYRAVREDFFVLCNNADPDASAATPAS